MAWRIELSAQALKSLKKIDKPIAKQIYQELRKLSELSDPRIKGKALTGNLRGLWRYRIGDYRLICHLESGELIILVLELGHRKSIYRNSKFN
ncbi:MAG: type II toxin-antitoxin system RelE/ParE family toxin [Arcanobacterium sp.]|nr:type II toxin-antitoxin system RelE/ParE family toxin [Arcanobacterium sp.]